MKKKEAIRVVGTLGIALEVMNIALKSAMDEGNEKVNELLADYFWVLGEYMAIANAYDIEVPILKFRKK